MLLLLVSLGYFKFLGEGKKFVDLNILIDVMCLSWGRLCKNEAVAIIHTMDKLYILKAHHIHIVNGCKT